MSEEALQIAEKEVKGKGTKKRYIQLNAEFQRIARKGKKTLSDQCQETEENHRMGKTRNLFKKIRDTKGTFPEKARASHSSTLAWEILWTEEPGGCSPWGL